MKKAADLDPFYRGLLEELRELERQPRADMGGLQLACGLGGVLFVGSLFVPVSSSPLFSMFVAGGGFVAFVGAGYRLWKENARRNASVDRRVHLDTALRAHGVDPAEWLHPR